MIRARLPRDGGQEYRLIQLSCGRGPSASMSSEDLEG